MRPRGDVGKNGGMSRFVFLPADSECDQLVKRRNTESGSGRGRKGIGGWGGPIAFTVRVFGRALSQEGVEKKRRGEGRGGQYNITNIMTNKRTFQSFVVPFPLTSPNLFNSQILKRV